MSYKKFLKLSTLAPFLILFISFLTYFTNYDYPSALFWDENYYLTAATKYQKGIFFQESHPPLGKLIIAAGESIINPNKGLSNEFEKSDYTKTLPHEFSFKGMRFFPVLFACASAVLFYFIVVSLVANPLWALVMSGFYLFDNTLITHYRGTMLDSIQLFGILVTLLAFLMCYRNKAITKKWLIVMGLGVAWATWTKLNGAITILFPALLFFLVPGRGVEKVKSYLKHTTWIIGSFLVLTIVVWQTHFSLGKRLEPALQNEGWYFASDELREIKLHPEEHKNFVNNFVVEMRDYFVYMKQYAAGVPELNLCKKGENGSPFYWWPLGGKTINYRWETQDSGQSYAYIYLVTNPVSWFLACIAVLMTLAYFLMRGMFSSFKSEFTHEFPLLCFTVVYLGYMVSMARISRVMYLYHYFVPFIFSLLMLTLWIDKLEKKLVIPRLHRYIMGAVFASFIFYCPFSYYRALTCEQFKIRALIPLWDLQGINCK